MVGEKGRQNKAGQKKNLYSKIFFLGWVCGAEKGKCTSVRFCSTGACVELCSVWRARAKKMYIHKIYFDLFWFGFFT